jgi:hypothetical protein
LNEPVLKYAEQQGLGMVYRILRHTEFEPAALQVMANAFEDVCRELGLAQTEDPLRDLVAEVIIKCVQDGERDEDRIRECARNALKN